jgi:hypothetical protein
LRRWTYIVGFAFGQDEFIDKSEEWPTSIRDRLRRRLSAPKRIGCPYRIAADSVAPGFDVSAWLPDEVMTKFFTAG